MAAETGTCTPEGLKISRRPLSLIRERRRQNSPPGATSSLETTVVGDDSADVFRGVGSKELTDMIEWLCAICYYYFSAKDFRWGNQIEHDKIPRLIE